MRPFSCYNKNLKGSFAMKIIDSHLHLCQTEGFCRTAAFAHCENSMVYVQKEFAKNNIVMGIGMGNQPFDTKDTAPLVCNLAGQMILEPYNYPQNIACCLGIAADKITKENQKQMVDSFAQALACFHIVGLKVYAGYRTGTDADGIILAGAGAKGACTCIPLRYMHTPVEVINAADMENTAKLAAAYVAQKVRPEGGCR